MIILKDKRVSNFFVFLFAILIFIGFFILFKKDQASKFVSNLIVRGDINALVDTIQKEISTPGALVAKIESNKAYLTKGGVLSFTNKERLNANLHLFATNQTLDQIAKSRLNDMFAKGYFEHVSPSGESASTVAESYKYEYISIGENIALGNFENDQTLVAAWMASPGHRANILNTHFTELGIAVGKGIYNGKSTWIGVQIFARPLSLCTKIDEALKNKIDNETVELAVLQKQIEILEAELKELSKDKGYNRDEYNKKVNEYNVLASNINSRITPLKQDIQKFNETVRSFNSCIETQ